MDIDNKRWCGLCGKEVTESLGSTGYLEFFANNLTKGYTFCCAECLGKAMDLIRYNFPDSHMVKMIEFGPKKKQ